MGKSLRALSSFGTCATHDRLADIWIVTVPGSSLRESPDEVAASTDAGQEAGTGVRGRSSGEGGTGAASRGMRQC
jgi:hypothetical protein